MKITLAAARVTVIAAVLIGFMEGRASAATATPVPGVSIIVKRQGPLFMGQPPKSIAMVSNQAGRFGSADANLGPGKWLLSVKFPKKASGTGRSSIKLDGRPMDNGQGVAVFTVSVTLGTGEPEPLEIEIPKGGGIIRGIVTRADEPTKGGTP